MLEERERGLGVEAGALRRERDQLATERNDLFALAERRLTDIETARADAARVAKQLEEVYCIHWGHFWRSLSHHCLPFRPTPRGAPPW